MRTVLSEEAVARRGRYGWGVDCQAREVEGGVHVARGLRLCVVGVVAAGGDGGGEEKGIV